MSVVVNPILSPTALLKTLMPGVYPRWMIYDPTWNDPAYNSYLGQRIVPAVDSLVKDTDGTPLWVTSVDPDTHFPTYSTVVLNSDNDNSVSLLNYGNTTFRLYVDYRAKPYPVKPDSKCIFIGKSPRFYTLVRNAGTDKESVVSQYFDSTGKFSSQMIPLVSLTDKLNSWYLPRCRTSVILDPNEEIEVRVYSEDGAQVHSATLFVKESAVINENVLYAPTVVGMTLSGDQQLADGTFYLYEKQAFNSLGLTASLVYDDGRVDVAPIDNIKCFLYGHQDFISSFAGLKQKITVKYFRSKNEAIAPVIADKTGQMISIDGLVTVIPNTLATTNKILAIPMYNASLAQYMMRYWLYFADGRSSIDISAYVSINSGKLVPSSSYFGQSQTYTVVVDMNKVDPVHYPVPTIYQQNFTVVLNPPTTLVKWTVKDGATSPYILGQDSAVAKRPSIKYDSVRKQYFIPSSVFLNKAAFINSFYTQASPPYDPSVSLRPQQPTHFVIRDIATGVMVVAAPIAIDNYAQAFTILNDSTGKYVGMSLVVEFINKVNSSVSNILFGVGTDVTSGTYIGA